MKKENKSLYGFISGVFLFFTTIIIGSVLTSFLPRMQLKKTDSINANWIEENLKERQILLKIQNTYLINDQEQVENIFLNSYFYDDNTLLMPYKCFEVDESLKLKSKSIFWTDFKTGNDKNIKDDSIWNEIDNINNFDSKSLPKNQQFFKFNYSKQNDKLKSKPLNFDYFLRKSQYEYNYYYSSFYIENDIVKYVYKPVLMKENSINKISKSYSLCNFETNKIQYLNTYESNIFKVANEFNMRSIGTLNSLIIDPIGNIEGFQCEQDEVNDVLFYGLKGVA